MFIRFSLDLGPIQVQVLLRSPLIPLLSLGSIQLIYAHEFKSISLIVHHFIIIKTLFGDYTTEPLRDLLKNPTNLIGFQSMTKHFLWFPRTASDMAKCKRVSCKGSS